MKYNVLIASLLVALAGCDQISQPSDVSSVPAAETNQPEVPEPATQPCPEPTGYQVMPAGLNLSIPYHVRADIIQKDGSGQSRRHIVLEYLDGDLETTVSAIEQSLAEGGFAPRPRRETDDGRIVIPFFKTGYDNIVVVVGPTPGNNPSNPEAKGTVTLQFTMEDSFADPGPGGTS